MDAIQAMTARGHSQGHIENLINTALKCGAECAAFWSAVASEAQHRYGWQARWQR